MSTLALWQKPELRTDEDEARERKASWLELFYDLVFVAIIAQLAHGLAGDVSWRGIAYFALPFVPAWWLWIGGTIYAERFETEDVGHRLFTFLQMVPVAAMAVMVHGGLEGSSGGFAIAYAVGRMLIIAMWIRGGWHNPPARPVTNLFAVGFSTSVLIFLGSLLVPAPQRYILWTLALAIDLMVPMTTLPHQKKLPQFSTSRLPERFGLFTIIVLGETIVGVVSGLVENHNLTWDIGLVGLFGMALAFGLWWLYFDGVSHRSPHPGIQFALARNYLHLPLVLSITAIGAGVLQLLGHADHGVPDSVRWLLCGATASFLVCLGLLSAVVETGLPTPRRRKLHKAMIFGAALLVLGMVPLTASLGAVAFSAGLVLLLVVLVVADVILRRPAIP